ncbi:MAG: Spy/CpxP family protein refolding chaperone [Spirochaetia bacterium]|nr:Spy/CpxP family protein refolding chaperone [Spirochaetia bacterium]
MNRKFLIGAAVGLVAGIGVTMGGTFWMCQRWGPFSNSADARAAWVVRKLSGELKLDKEQRAQLERIKDDVLKKRTQMEPGRKSIHQAILDQVTAEKIDPVALNQIFEDHTGEMKATRLYLITRFAEFHAKLTPEQKVTLKKKMEHFLEHHDSPL